MNLGDSDWGFDAD